MRYRFVVNTKDEVATTGKSATVREYEGSI